MTDRVECGSCRGEGKVRMFGRTERCEECDGERYLPMEDIPHIMPRREEGSAKESKNG